MASSGPHEPTRLHEKLEAKQEVVAAGRDISEGVLSAPYQYWLCTRRHYEHTCGTKSKLSQVWPAPDPAKGFKPDAVDEDDHQNERLCCVFALTLEDDAGTLLRDRGMCGACIERSRLEAPVAAMRVAFWHL